MLSYDVKNIKTLEGIEAIRMRPRHVCSQHWL